MFKNKLIVAIVLSLFAPVVFANSILPMEAYGLDTVAGYATVLRTSKVDAGKDVVFDIRKPSGKIISLNTLSNSNGVALVNLSDYYTREAGIYNVSAKLEGLTSSGWRNFTVYPSSVSTSASTISPTDQVIRSSDENAKLVVKLVDEYGNPIEGHQLKIISSSKDDDINVDSQISDQFGSATFVLSSNSSGTSTYSVYDVTADRILDSKARVVYFESDDYVFSNKEPSYYYASTFALGGPVDSFEFEDVPDQINPGETISVKVSAMDSQNQKASDYLGTLRFSVEGENAPFAKTPDDYTFVLADQGSHTFSLALLFQQAGDYKMKVTDLNNPGIFGEKTFSVVDASYVDGGAEIVISNPSSGNTYSNSVQVISGKATPGSSLKIFDNDVEMHSLIADLNGDFSYTTGPLLVGSHKIYVASVNGDGTILKTSKITEIAIDVSGPQISQALIEPSGEVDPGSAVKITLNVSDELSKASMVLQGSVYEFAKTPEGKYTLEVAAPMDFGEYPLDFIIADELGNESNYKAHSTLKVGKLVVAVIEVGEVTGLKATPGDSRVTLNWIAPLSSTNPIKNYRIFYGISPNQLTEATDTFTDSTTWYIPNLNNNVEYFFTVLAVDTAGNTASVFGDIVASIPVPPVVYTPPPSFVFGARAEESEQALEEMEEDVSDSGPELTWLILLSAIGGIFYSESRRRKLSKGIGL